MRYITSCVVILAIGLALVQAAPKKIEKKSISDAGAPKAIEQVSQNLDAPATLGDEALLEDADGHNVDRAKKQASTTFCVEVRPNKPTQVDCSELNNNQPQQPSPPPQSEPEPRPQLNNYRPPEINIDISPPPAPMGPPCEPEITGFIAPGGDVVYAPTGNCAHNIPNTFQTPYSGPSSMMPSGPDGHVHELHIPGGFPHRGFPGNYPSTGLPGGYPAGMIPNSGAGFPNIHISTGPSGSGGFPMNGLPNGGLPNGGLPYGGAGMPSINIIPGTGLPGGLPNGGYPSGGYPSSGYPSGGSPIHVLHLPGGGLPSGPSAGGSGFPNGMPFGGLPHNAAGMPTINIIPGTGLPGGLPNGGYPSGGYPSSGYPSGGSPIHVLHLPGGGLPSGPSAGGNGFPSGMPFGGLPHNGAGVPTINIVPGTGLPGGLPNGGYPSGGYPNSGYPSGGSPIHVLHLPGGGLPSGPSAGGSGFPTIYITPGSGTPGVSPLGPHLPSLHPGHTHDHHHGPHQLNGVECTCTSNFGTNLYRSDGGMPSNEQLAAQFLDNIQKNTQQQPGSSGISMAPRSDGWGVSAGQTNTGKSAVMYSMGSMMTPGMSMGMPMRSNSQYDDSFQSGYPMQGLRLSRGPDEADAKAAEKEDGSKPATEEEAAKKSSTSEIMDKMVKKTQEDEIETKHTRLARFLMGKKDAKSNLLDDE